MMLHAPLMTAALTLLLLSAVLASAGRQATVPFIGAGAIIAALALERFVVGVRAVFTFHNAAGWWFVPVHLTRDVAWAAAIVVWAARRLRGVAPRPSHSMRPRPLADRFDRQQSGG